MTAGKSVKTKKATSGGGRPRKNARTDRSPRNLPLEKEIQRVFRDEKAVGERMSITRGMIRTGGNLKNNPDGKKPYSFWRKESSIRYKLERMMYLSADELQAVAFDIEAPVFERRIAQLMGNNTLKWSTIESMINQVYGLPKQKIEAVEVQLQPILQEMECSEKPERSEESENYTAE